MEHIEKLSGQELRQTLKEAILQLTDKQVEYVLERMKRSVMI